MMVLIEKKTKRKEAETKEREALMSCKSFHPDVPRASVALDF
jgi:hypothetical protein